MRSPGLNKAFSESFRRRQVTISILCKFLTLSCRLTATFIGCVLPIAPLLQGQGTRLSKPVSGQQLVWCYHGSAGG